MAHDTPVDRLVHLLDLEREDDDGFVAATGSGKRRLFGGLVAAQAVVAAAGTVEDMALHSLHGYFLRPGRFGTPIRYAISRLKQGRVFHVRQIVATQEREVIFTAQASFARPEPGISHQDPMPEVPPPDDLPDRDRLRGREDWAKQPIELRTCDPIAEDGPEEARKRLWMRPRGVLPDDPLLHTAFLVYASDRSLISTGARPHASPNKRRRAASLDHSLWLHHPPRFDDWHLHVMESPAAHAARALVHGAIYRRDGTRVASVCQEGLIRYEEGDPIR